MRHEIHTLPFGPIGSLARVARLARITLTAAFVALVAALSGCGAGEEGENRAFLLRPNGDLLAGGDAVSISDSVPGDVMAGAGEVRFDGVTGGSLLAAGGEVFTLGRVDGSLRAAGGAVRVGSSVRRNVTAVGGAVEIRPEAVVERNAYLGAGAIQIAGTVHGDVYAGGEAVTVTGHVGGDLRVEAEELTVGPDARIDGELRYRLAEDGIVSIASGAVVAQGVHELEPREEGDDLMVPMLRLLAFLAFGIVVVATFPATSVRMVLPMQDRPAGAFGAGILCGVLTPIVVLVTAITLLGIPLALAGAALFGIVLYAAPILPSLWLGSAILQGRDLSVREGAVFAFMAGGFTIGLLCLLPGIGWVVRVLATALGIGAMVLFVRASRVSKSTPGSSAPL